MNEETLPPAQLLVHRIFWFQVVLIVVTSILFVVVSQTGHIGFFWFAFIAGAFGSSIALLRQVRSKPESIQRTINDSWPLTLSPFLYGAVLAGMTYLLFASQLISGVDGEGLIKTNLFPDFGHNLPDKSSGQTSLADVRTFAPKTVLDAGKLIVWCFIAGYSEEFVTKILGNLERQVVSGDSEGVSRKRGY